MKKVIFAVLIALLVIGVVIFYLQVMRPPTVSTVEDEFFKNYQNILLIKDYLLRSGYDSIYIHSTNSYMFADMQDILIPNDDVRESIKSLMENGEYSVIIKDGNTIWFQQWTRFTDAGAGLAYSPSEAELNKIQHLTEYEALSEANWYYYVDDYNEWRKS